MAREKKYVAVPDKDSEGYQVSKFEDTDATPTETYTVDGTGACECPGFRFRKSCRHTKFLAVLLEDRSGSLSPSETDLEVATKKVEGALAGVTGSFVTTVLRDSAGEFLAVSITAELTEEPDQPECVRFFVNGVPFEVNVS